MKNTVIKYSEMLMPYVKSTHIDTANVKFAVGDRIGNFEAYSILTRFQNKLTELSEDKLSALIVATKEQLETCPYKFTRESYKIIISSCNSELRKRKLSASATVVR